MKAANFRDGTSFDALLAAIGPRLTLLRHDTCGSTNLAPALAFAAMEAERGVRATYFVWMSLAGFGEPRLEDDIRALRDLGHGIGLHYDVLHRMLRDGTRPAVELRRALDWLRRTGDVTMAAAHGHESNYRHAMREYEVFDDFDASFNEGGGAATWAFERASAQELGVIEPYLHGEHNVSLSDSRGIWTGWRDRACRPFERLPDAENLGRGVLEDLRETDRVHLLLHPCHWRVTA